jgi:hypothetical protein
MTEPLFVLPTAARNLLASLVGRRLLAVRRTGVDPALAASLARDAGRGDLELELEGLRLSLVADPERRSVLVGAVALGGETVDVSASAFWRWRMRREVEGVRVWKSLDVPETADELEFGLEMGLRGTRGLVVELIEDEGIAGLVVSDGEGSERHRVLELAGVVTPARSGLTSQGRRGPAKAGAGRSSRRRR